MGGWGAGGQTGAQSTAPAELSPLCAPGPRTGRPGRPGWGRGLSPQPGRPHLRLCSASVSLSVSQCRPARSRSPVSLLRGAGGAGGRYSHRLRPMSAGGVLVVATRGESPTQ